MNVLLISRDTRLAEPIGLNEVQLRHIAYARALDRLDILVESPGPSSESFALDAKVHVHPIDRRARLAFPAAALSRWRTLSTTIRPDVVTTQDPFLAGLAGLALARWKRIPLNVQIHSDQLDNPYFLRESPLNRLLNQTAKSVIKRARTIRTVNRHTTEQCHRLGLPAKHCFTIPLVFGLEPFFEAKERGLRNSLLGRRAKTTALILYVGRMSREKGWDLLLDAFRKIRGGRGETQLVYVGDGPGAERAEIRARRWGIGDSVRFLGWLPYSELPRHFAAADFVVNPSRHEGFGRSTLEAQSAGTAVIASDTAGTRDLVRPERTGVIVHVEDRAALRQAIQDLIGDSEKRARLGSLARKEAREKWSGYDLPGELARMFEKTAQGVSL